MASSFDRLDAYFCTLKSLLSTTAVTDRSARPVPLSEACEQMAGWAQDAHDRGQKLMFVGNGGSAAISSHLAIDYSKNGGIRSTAFNDGASLTCLGNDLGFGRIFAEQILLHGREGDMLVVISSSGRSSSVLEAVSAGRQRGCRVVTYSGFDPANDLRRLGDLNFYVASGEYGFVEVGHLALCHAVLDIHMGWRAND